MQTKGECIRIIKKKGHVEQNLYLNCEKERKSNYCGAKMSWKSFGINEQKR